MFVELIIFREGMKTMGTAPAQLENHDLNDASYRDGWGRSHKTYLDNWFHSDMKDMAYFYVYPLYDELKTKGNLK